MIYAPRAFGLHNYSVVGKVSKDPPERL